MSLDSLRGGSSTRTSKILRGFTANTLTFEAKQTLAELLNMLDSSSQPCNEQGQEDLGIKTSSETCSQLLTKMAGSKSWDAQARRSRPESKVA